MTAEQGVHWIAGIYTRAAQALGCSLNAARAGDASEAD